ASQVIGQGGRRRLRELLRAGGVINRLAERLAEITRSRVEAGLDLAQRIVEVLQLALNRIERRSEVVRQVVCFRAGKSGHEPQSRTLVGHQLLEYGADGVPVAARVFGQDINQETNVTLRVI